MTGKTSTRVYWVLAILTALVFLMSSLTKLTGDATMIESFGRYGYSIGFMYFIGVAELLGALGLLLGKFITPKVPRLAAGGLVIIMLGAIVTHALHDPIQQAVPAVITLAMLSGILYVELKRI
jgi:putative oxidoreductase